MSVESAFACVGACECVCVCVGACYFNSHGNKNLKKQKDEWSWNFNEPLSFDQFFILILFSFLFPGELMTALPCRSPWHCLDEVRGSALPKLVALQTG